MVRIQLSLSWPRFSSLANCVVQPIGEIKKVSNLFC